MLDADGFFGPWQYPLWGLWLALGLLLLGLVVAWVVFVVRFTARRLPPRDRALERAVRVDLPSVRARYLGLIDEVEEASVSGRLDDRAAHGRLSLLVRFFVHETAGVDTHVMTLADLRESDLPRLAGAVETWYPPVFRHDSPGDVRAAVATAREVVTTWA